MPYREGTENERRTVDDLFRHVKRYVNTHRQFTPRDDPAWQSFGASAFLANLASHDPAGVPVPLSSGDISFALDRLDVLVELFRCDICGKWAWMLRRNPNDPDTQCECGGLRFK